MESIKILAGAMLFLCFMPLLFSPSLVGIAGFLLMLYTFCYLGKWAQALQGRHSNRGCSRARRRRRRSFF